ncbi:MULTISPECIES: alpha/beta hydrolase [unclassified Moorena]|uniref:alpha/beta fold hydrolase n=1 Tax=unclassified Moorena TaxID=2683338 RepID=UPI0013CC013A|nr:MULTISPECIES: alpha/beta hydrolase [unclassified Moorena]NEO19754.1 alpha/beta hydrolase [Moorena sp. SIO4A5]NEP25330.1 alpha/beta hydrolase [Moorena sp. SIO3I6]NEQ58785.1 alpha/beta hydrolase [Moorena sp. SIO4A1]
MEEIYIKINGCEYYVQDSRNGNDSVILLHGWPDDSSLWRFQIPALIQSGYRVICLDWLGHGQSEKTEDLNKYTLASLSADVIGLMDALNLEKAHCIAHDYGAVVGWELATRYPERLVSYVALSVGHPLALVKNFSLESILKSWYLIFNPLPVAIPIYRAMNGLIFRWVLRGHPDKENVVEKFLLEKKPFYIQVWEKANPILPFILSSLRQQQSQLTLIKVPTLGIWSSGDNFMAEEQMRKSSALVQSEWKYIKISKCNHWLQLEKPQEINKHLLEWLNQQGEKC